MLYRNPEPVRLPRYPGFVGRILDRLRRHRKRRLATLDLAALGAHRRRDLGLEDFPFRGSR